MSEIERELAKELGYTKSPGGWVDENNCVLWKTSEFRDLAEALYMSLVSSREQLATLRAEHERLKQERNEARNAAFFAFVEGAKFWEFQRSGATMWNSDVSLCEKKAQEKYPYAPHLHVVEANARAVAAERRVAELKEALKRFVENRHIIMPAIAGRDSFKRYFDAARTLLEADRKLRGEE